MIARCKTCSFWKRHGEKHMWGVCHQASLVNGVSLCIGSKMSAMADGHQDRGVKFVETHETFGCVMHPANEAIK